MNRLGALIPASNVVVEKELFSAILYEKNLRDNFTIHFSRLSFSTRYSENKKRYFENLYRSIPDAMKQLHWLDIKNYGFFCTAASLLFSEPISFSSLQITNPLEGILSTVQRLGLRNGLMITPYDFETSKSIADVINREEKYIREFVYYDLKVRSEYIDFSHSIIEEVTHKLYKPGYRFVVFLCTNIETFHIIQKLEKKLGIPVISSNQALLWLMLKNTKIPLELSDKFGLIFKYMKD
jgi:maleate isomerase